MTGFPQVIKIQEIKSTLLIFLLLLNFFACLDFVKLSNIQTWIAYTADSLPIQYPHSVRKSEGKNCNLVRFKSILRLVATLS